MLWLWNQAYNSCNLEIYCCSDLSPVSWIVCISCWKVRFSLMRTDVHLKFSVENTWWKKFMAKIFSVSLSCFHFGSNFRGNDVVCLHCLYWYDYYSAYWYLQTLCSGTRLHHFTCKLFKGYFPLGISAWVAAHPLSIINDPFMQDKIQNFIW